MVFGIGLLAFEGIGMVFPVQDITADKENYPKVLAAVMFTICAIFVIFGQFCCMAWGQAI